MSLLAEHQMMMDVAAAGVTMGLTTFNGTVPGSGNRLWLGLFTAPASGALTVAHVITSAAASGNGKIVLVANMAGDTPAGGAVLAVSASFACTGTLGQKNTTFSVPGIVLGTKYWLGWVNDGGCFADFKGNAGLSSTFKQALVNGGFSFSSPPSTCPAVDGLDVGQCPTVWADLV